jgi:hypothetical protein
MSRHFSIAPHDGRRPTIRAFQMPPPAIQYLTALVEASDGIGLTRTLDERRGMVECWMMPGFIDEFEALLAAVGREWPIQPLGEEIE